MSHFTFDFSGMEKSKRRKGADYFSFPLFLNGKYFCLPEKDVSEYYLIILFDFKTFFFAQKLDNPVTHIVSLHSGNRKDHGLSPHPPP